MLFKPVGNFLKSKQVFGEKSFHLDFSLDQFPSSMIFFLSVFTIDISSSSQDWISIIACKQAGYHAIAEYYQALVHKANKEIGEELARLKVR